MNLALSNRKWLAETEFGRLWRWLTRPHPTITAADQQQQAKFLSGLLVVFDTAVTLVILVFILFRNYQITPPILLAVILLWVAYGLSRTRYYTQTVMLTIGVIEFGLLGQMISAGSTANVTVLYYLIISIVMASMLLTPRITLYLIVANLIVIALLPRLVPGLPDVVTNLTFFVIISVLLMVFVQHRNQLEKFRQERLAEALEQTVKANEALTKANALARENARLKSEFMSTMSHELRTPLNAVLGFTGIMLEGMAGEIDEEARGMLERINSNSTRLLTLINEVLDLARIEAGRMELVHKPFAPRALAEQWQKQMEVLAAEKELSFDVVIDPALPQEIMGDPDRITQVAVNLLSNAFKFTETGGVKLTLNTQGETWTLQVSDTGIGIPPHAINYIFDEFRQVDGSTMRMYGGSGLGLAIVRNLCTLMNGSIKVTSVLREGSVFTVTLPLETTATQEAPALLSLEGSLVS